MSFDPDVWYAILAALVATAIAVPFLMGMWHIAKALLFMSEPWRERLMSKISGPPTASTGPGSGVRWPRFGGSTREAEAAFARLGAAARQASVDVDPTLWAVGQYEILRNEGDGLYYIVGGRGGFLSVAAAQEYLEGQRRLGLRPDQTNERRPLSELYREEEARRRYEIVHDGMSSTWVYRGIHYASQRQAEARRDIDRAQRERLVAADERAAREIEDFVLDEMQREQTGVGRSAGEPRQEGGGLSGPPIGRDVSRGGFLDLD